MTACLLHNESASCPGRRGEAGGGAEAKASANSALSRPGQTRSWVIYPWPGRTPGDTGRRAAPVGVEKPLDEPRMGAKDQSNPVIAGSLRNGFRASLGRTARGGRATVRRRVPTGMPKPAELRIPTARTPGVRLRGISSVVERGTAQTAGQGPQSRPQWIVRMWRRDDIQDVGSEAAII